MTLSRFLATLGYACGAAAAAIATGGLAVPAWIAVALTIAAPAFAHLAGSPLPAPKPPEVK